MPDKPLEILSTKQLSQTVLAIANANNITINCVPFIEISAIVNDELESTINSIVAKKAIVIFTSSNAVKAVASHIKKNPQWTIFCLFGATKNEVQKYFPTSTIIETAVTSEQLAEKIKIQNINEACFFCGEKRMDTISEALAKTPVKLHQVIVYKTDANPQKITKEYDGILFFSPSGVESFFELNTINENTLSFALGNTTAKAIKKFCRNKVIICDEPTPENMIEKIIQQQLNEKRY